MECNATEMQHWTLKDDLCSSARSEAPQFTATPTSSEARNKKALPKLRQGWTNGQTPHHRIEINNVTCCGHNQAKQLRLRPSKSASVLGKMVPEGPIEKHMWIQPSSRTKLPLRPWSALASSKNYDLEHTFQTLEENEATLLHCSQHFSQHQFASLVCDETKRRTHFPVLVDSALTASIRGRDYQKCIKMVSESIKGIRENKHREEASPLIEHAETQACPLTGNVKDSSHCILLLLWILGVCLEAVAQLDLAEITFAQCSSLDPGNPVHLYHQAMCLWRMNKMQQAWSAFNSAVAHCLANQTPPPLAFLVGRALAAATLPGKLAEVWADLELTRRRIQNPALPFPLILLKATGGVDGFAGYNDAVLTPVPPAGDHHHWISVLVARIHNQTCESVSDFESASLINFLRRLPELESCAQEVLKQHFYDFCIRRVPAGKPLLLNSCWCCILYGSLDLTQFSTKSAPGFDEENECLSVIARRFRSHSNTWSRVPLTLLEPPRIEGRRCLREMDTFQQGDALCQDEDGWLIGGRDDGAELLCLPLRTFGYLQQHAGSRLGASGDVAMLGRVPIFRSCSASLLRVAIDEVLEEREALHGENILQIWKGLCIIKHGELRILREGRGCSSRARSTGITATSRGPAFGRSASSSRRNLHTKLQYNKGHFKEVCCLRRGDTIGEETILGGSPALVCHHAEVCSAVLKAWVLPTEKLPQVEATGLLMHLTKCRDAGRAHFRQRMKDAAAWAGLQERLVADALQS